MPPVSEPTTRYLVGKREGSKRLDRFLHERMPKLPDHFDIIDNATDERPFRLIAAPAHNYLNSSFTETPTSQKKEVRPTVLMHPEDCADDMT